MGFLGLGQNSFKATPYGQPDETAAQIAQQTQDAYQNPYLAADKTQIRMDQAARNGVAAPTASAAIAGPAAMAQGPNMGQSDQIRGMNMGALQGLQAAANGTVPSAAQIQGQQQLAQALQAQRGQAASMRGVSPALAQHLAAQAGAQMQDQALVNAGQLHANEQANARSTYAQALDAARGQDLSAAGLQQQTNLFNAGNQQQTNLFNAGNQQQTALANQQAALQAQGQRDAMNQFYTGQQFGMDQNQANANIAYSQAMQNAYQNAQAINAQISQGNANNAASLTGGLISAGGQAGAMLSDERAKEAIDREGAGKDIDGFLKALDAASWNYRKGVGEDPNKRHWGVMAQSLAKTDVGRSMLQTGGDGLLRIDTAQGFGALLAAQKRLNDRLEELERIRSKRA